MSTYDPERTDEAWHLLRKVFLLFLVVIASALGLVILSRQRSHVPPFLFNILADASLGLIAGLATRWVLRGRNLVVQGLASAAVSLVGLGIIGYFTNWKSGIGPLQAGLVSVHWLDWAHVALRLPVQFGRSSMDLLDLAHMVIAADTSWIALRVWRQTVDFGAQRSAPAEHVRRPARSPRPARAAVTPIVPAPKAPASTGSNSRAKVRRKKAGRALVSRPAASAIRPMRSRTQPLSKTGQRRNRRPTIHFAVHEEHRCPYCLEPVKRNDPRGTVECQVCHTLHHKDCWDITGNCQVPHLNI
jgi:hypothetical protein